MASNAYMREYRRKNADKIKAARKARRDLIHALKAVPCGRCGGSFPAVCMDFHHRDPETKEFSIGTNAGTICLSKLLAEIDKCDILCANCHRIVEYEEA